MKTINDALKQLRDALSKLSELEEPLKTLKEDIQKIVDTYETTPSEDIKYDPFEEYWKDIQEASDNRTAWYINDNANKDYGKLTADSVKQAFANGDYYNPYQHYFNKEYAAMAQRAKKFNDVCLAWKWCYEKDYIPDYNDGLYKYIILYSESQGRFITQIAVERHNPSLVIFKSNEVAENLADWLNEHKKEFIEVII